MELMNLRMPPDKATTMANAIERDLDINRVGPEADDLRVTLTWLRHRIARWNAEHPAGHVV